MLHLINDLWSKCLSEIVHNILFHLLGLPVFVYLGFTVLLQQFHINQLFGFVRWLVVNKLLEDEFEFPCGNIKWVELVFEWQPWSTWYRWTSWLGLRHWLLGLSWWELGMNQIKSFSNFSVLFLYIIVDFFFSRIFNYSLMIFRSFLLSLEFLISFPVWHFWFQGLNFLLFDFNNFNWFLSIFKFFLFILNLLLNPFFLSSFSLSLGRHHINFSLFSLGFSLVKAFLELNLLLFLLIELSLGFKQLLTELINFFGWHCWLCWGSWLWLVSRRRTWGTTWAFSVQVVSTTICDNFVLEHRELNIVALSWLHSSIERNRVWWSAGIACRSKLKCLADATVWRNSKVSLGKVLKHLWVFDFRFN